MDYNKKIQISRLPYTFKQSGIIYLDGQVWTNRSNVFLNGICIISYYQNATSCDSHSNSSSAIVSKGDTLSSNGYAGNITFVPFK